MLIRPKIGRALGCHIGAWCFALTSLATLGLTPVLAADTQPFVRQGDKIVVPAESALRTRLRLAPAVVQTTQPKLLLPAFVEADPARTILLLPALAGRVVSLKVGLGDRVRRGQVLAELESPDLAQAYDDNDKAEDSLRLADKTLKRQEEQAKINAISAQELDQARSDLAQAQAEVTRTQARLRAVGAAAGSKSRLLEVTAPIDGSVTALSVAAGAVVNDPTQPLMTINDLSTVWVTAMVAEGDVAQVAPGQTAEIALAAYPGQTHTGRLAFVADQLDADSRRARVRILLPNPQLRFKPNMFGTVSVSGPERRLVVLPTSALLMNNDRISVFVETGTPWSFERRTVQADLQDAQEAVIKSGLVGGERVVVAGGVLLND